MDKAGVTAPARRGLVPAAGASGHAELRTGQTRTDNALTTIFVWIAAGDFTMGSPLDERDRGDDEGQVRVALSEGFWLGQHEVTQTEWRRLMQTTPWAEISYVQEGDTYPATFISWDEAAEFCAKLTVFDRRAGRLSDGWAYALPTEAQWEYACRAGSTSRFSFGDNDSSLTEYVWFDHDTRDTGEKFAHQVAKKKASPWGLHDMHGNVWEWCRDWYTGEPSGGRDPQGPKDGLWRVLRGGGWNDPGRRCRSAIRVRQLPTYRSNDTGFRLSLIRTTTSPAPGTQAPGPPLNPRPQESAGPAVDSVLQQAREITEKMPDSEGALGDIAALYAKAQDVQAALEIANRVKAKGQIYAPFADAILEKIAVAQAENGSVQEPIKTANLIVETSPVRKPQALARAAFALASAGNQAGAQEVISHALAAAQQSTAPIAEGILPLIVRAQAKAGDIDGARRTIAAMKQTERDPGLVWLAAAQAEGGDINGALATVHMIASPTGLFQGQALIAIANESARIGDMRNARLCVDGLILPEDKIRALAGIARSQATGGKESDARDTLNEAHQIADSVRPQTVGEAAVKGQALRDISITETSLGALEHALQTANSIPNIDSDGVGSRPIALAEIAIAQSAKGDVVAARRTFDLAVRVAEGNKSAEDVFKTIAKAQTRAGRADQALAWSSRLIAPANKVSALLGIADGVLEKSSTPARPSSRVER